MSYQVRRYNNAKHNRPEEQIVVGFFKVIWWIISLPFRLILGKNKRTSAQKDNSIDKGYINTKWQEIEQLMKLGSPSNYSRAVLEADKLLDHILKGYRAPGTTMGDRLKASQNRFSPEGYDAAWQAHKVRNEIVHSSTYELMDYSAKDAINNFKKAIDELMS